jgi:hypothetical protein
MRIRLAQPDSDIPGIAGLVNTFERQPLTVAAVEKWFEHMPPGRITHRMVAVDEIKMPKRFFMSRARFT